ncbi:bromodomain and WD repeat-containing protein 1-like [Cucurbita moschata]|uniref:Bromodomain and WD repeat-containing protein 1-like n=1 Tax=Cucurbita moschata TaxID=3662 RepID=A0A6J1GWZ7_CUCMO|nr:bromodomain and WD repeat-containing protein 1-like [Cucurbita moschata]XP_022955685.1 bromodomain and WD repeat-containing protein 1-like [Cucurbita moschata]
MTNMALRKFVCGATPSINLKHSSFPAKVHEQAQFEEPETNQTLEPDVEIDPREVYFLIMHFLSSGPCRRTCGLLWDELFENQLLPRRYHAWYSRNGMHSGHENDDGLSFPLSYQHLVERYPHVDKNHLIKLLKQLMLNKAPPSRGMSGAIAPNAADVPTLLGTGTFSLLSYDKHDGVGKPSGPPAHMRWPHMKADSVRGLSLREIGGGFSRHQRAPSVRAACYAIAKPSTMVQKMQNIKRLRGHRNAVYCASFDRMGRYVITGSDDRLVKIWSMETAYCLASCRGHEGDITDLAVSSNNAVVASSSNDFVIRVWRLPDGLPISVLRGHTGAVTAIAFSPRAAYQLLSSSDDGTCRLWDARSSSQNAPRIYVPRPLDSVTARNGGSSASTLPQSHQIFCCAFNACGTIFVTGSSDTLARVWSACKGNNDNPDQPNHEIDVLAGHENDVNYVQFSGCAVASRFTTTDIVKEDNVHKFKNSWFTYDNIVTCSRDGSAIIWVPRSRRSHGKVGRWTRAYHLKVPPPPMPPQPARGGPRQRILPTPRGVNMIIWSLDNRFVLAAIMDCRICVWNASDGSLVHSLTGHTESTYVLDVHPFNPRIAMSAGYDGKTIVWDIWEGTPIRIYEISHFKLVDGKFSSDGTSIILSDDVGQLYILSTGQGESQQDAKYDQFFLGDYRPLIQDPFGNVVDQETQLSTYRRNLQDLLSDSGMIPYPEPYQTAYQQRRLGAMGLEWRPSSLKLSTGPDFNLDPDYQLLPLADLDMLIEPLPEIVDAMDWGPENEVQSDDTDSEYNVTEDYSTGGEQRSLNSNCSTDSECSSDDTGIDDGLRRSKRKKQKAYMEVMTSSGRRVKRRNMDEYEGDTVRNSRNRKLKSGHRASKKKSASKSLRPQRAAARNARNWISSFKGKCTDGEDEYESGGDCSESESTLEDSDIESDEYERSLQNRNKHSKGKEVFLNEDELITKPLDVPESRVDSGNRKKLILKFSLKNPNKVDPPSNTTLTCTNMADVASSSSRSPKEVIETSQNLMRPERQFGNTDGHSNLTEVYTNGNIRWGGSKVRSSKRIRLDAYALSSPFRNGDHNENENTVHEYLERENHFGAPSPHSKIQNYCADETHAVSPTNLKDDDDNASGHSPEMVNGGELKCLSNSKSCDDHDDSNNLNFMFSSDATTSIQYGTPAPEQTENIAPMCTKIRLKSSSLDPEHSLKHKIESLDENSKNDEYYTVSGSPRPLNGLQDTVMNEAFSNLRNDCPQDMDTAMDEKPISTLCNSSELQAVETNKMYTAVYRRSKSNKGKSNIESNGCDSGEHALGNISLSAEANNHKSMLRKTRSLRFKDSYDPNNVCDDLKSDEDQELEQKSRRSGNSPANRSHIPSEEWGSSSRMTVGSRSTRNRRGSLTQDLNPVDRRKSVQYARKGSWLMMPAHEGGSRYIPQLGDEVAYLRQGHQEYIDHCCANYCHTKDMGPWTATRGTIRAVEFCKVVELVYSTSAGSGDSCCKMLLKFIDPVSSVYLQSFKLTLPELTSFPDFLVERTRFEAAMQRNWTFRDKCKVWWKNDVGVDGSWWDGRIVSVQPKSSEFPESPWERYTIKYRSDPAEPHLHSPWELYDIVTQWEQPRIDDENKAKLSTAFDQLMSAPMQGRYGIQDLMLLSRKTQFKNRFPVPLCLEIIQERLQNDYYRNLEALKHDFMVMLSNYESFVAKNEDMSKKIRRLSDWFNRNISPL